MVERTNKKVTPEEEKAHKHKAQNAKNRGKDSKATFHAVRVIGNGSFSVVYEAYERDATG